MCFVSALDLSAATCVDAKASAYTPISHASTCTYHIVLQIAELKAQQGAPLASTVSGGEQQELKWVLV